MSDQSIPSTTSLVQQVLSSAVPGTLAHGYRWCSGCAKEKKKDAFTGDSKLCNMCAGVSMPRIRDAREIARHQAELVKERVATIFAEFDRDETELPTLEKMIAQLVVQLGGIEHLAVTYAETINSSKCSPATKLRALQDLFKMIGMANAQAKTKRDLRNMRPDELIAMAQGILEEQGQKLGFRVVVDEPLDVETVHIEEPSPEQEVA